MANAMIRTVGILNKTKKLVRFALGPLSILENSAGILRKKRDNGTANRIPIPPSSQNETRQSNFWAMNALVDPPIATPMSWLVPKSAIARERVRGPCAAAMSAYPAGMKNDSEIPRRALQPSRNGPFGDRPDST